MASTDILQTNDSTVGESITASDTIGTTDTSLTNSTSILSSSPNNKPSTGRKRRGTVSQQQQPAVLTEKSKIEKPVIEEVEEESTEIISSPIPHPIESDELNKNSEQTIQSQEEPIQDDIDWGKV